MTSTRTERLAQATVELESDRLRELLAEQGRAPSRDQGDLGRRIAETRAAIADANRILA